MAQLTQAVDVYSFGVLLAFLFTGQDSPRVPPTFEVRPPGQSPTLPQ
jgi:hypothetical protein